MRGGVCGERGFLGLFGVWWVCWWLGRDWAFGWHVHFLGGIITGFFVVGF